MTEMKPVPEIEDEDEKDLTNMKEDAVNSELLSSVAGGDALSDDMEELINAMASVDGKKCKYCGQVYSHRKVVIYHYSKLLRYSNLYVMYGRAMIPCLGCGTWRYYKTDFTD